MADVVIARFTAHYGETGQIHEGELWEATHPLVKEHPDWFTDDILKYAVRDPNPPKPKPEPAPAAKKAAN